MIPWLIVAIAMVATFSVMHFAKGKKREGLILLGLFVLVVLASCAAIFLAACQGSDSTWIKAICVGLSMTCFSQMDDAKKKRKKKK